MRPAPESLGKMDVQPFRIERDSMGEVRVPADALWGAGTQRAIDNFRISGRRLPRTFIRALALVKQAAAAANAGLGLLDAALAQAIGAAAAAVAAGGHDAQFPVDVFQTGSGTSSNMNANEVIAALAARAGQAAHPNDHVNMGQSSNDAIPTAIHVGAALLLREALLPALEHLAAVIAGREAGLGAVVKTGRTHLMDAMPVTLAQELSAWRTQVENAMARLRATEARLLCLAQGGTAVGTGINAHPEFSTRFCAELQRLTAIGFRPSGNFFEALSSQDTAVELSGQLKVLAVSLMKIANDLRWMNSGPLAGLAEIALPALQPGSSIMPGKVNPVIPEAAAMVAAQVIGNDAAITVGGLQGQFELNVRIPLIARNLLQSIHLLSTASLAFAEKCVDGIEVNKEGAKRSAESTLAVATALNEHIGYDKGAAIVKKASESGRPLRDVAIEEGVEPGLYDRIIDLRKIAAGNQA